MFVALDEAGSGGVDAGFGVAGNGGVAVDDDDSGAGGWGWGSWAGVVCA